MDIAKTNNGLQMPSIERERESDWSDLMNINVSFT